LSGAIGAGQKSLAAQALKRDQKNIKTSVALEAKVLGGDGFEFPAALVAVTASLRTTMAKLSEGCNTEFGYACRQLRASTRCCKAFSGPVPEESVEAASVLAELLACLGKGSWSEPIYWQVAATIGSAILPWRATNGRRGR
jgi:hypothetical protein